jgi:hypothetical protein
VLSRSPSANSFFSLWQTQADPGRVARQVDRQGSVSLYNRTRYVGKQPVGRRVYVSLDPSGPTWVVAAADGTQRRTLPATELSAEHIRGLTVGGRTSRDKRT